MARSEDGPGDAVHGPSAGLRVGLPQLRATCEPKPQGSPARADSRHQAEWWKASKARGGAGGRGKPKRRPKRRRKKRTRSPDKRIYVAQAKTHDLQTRVVSAILRIIPRIAQANIGKELHRFSPSLPRSQHAPAPSTFTDGTRAKEQRF